MQAKSSRDIITSYPKRIRNIVMAIRDLILEESESNELVSEIEEAVRWGEPSFITTTGSTIRVAWKETDPDHVRVLFNCNTKLIDTFRQLYPVQLSFEGKRAIVLPVEAAIPATELRQCISLALQYHKLKKLPLLGM